MLLLRSIWVFLPSSREGGADLGRFGGLGFGSGAMFTVPIFSLVCLILWFGMTVMMDPALVELDELLRVLDVEAHFNIVCTLRKDEDISLKVWVLNLPIELKESMGEKLLLIAEGSSLGFLTKLHS